MPKVIGQAIKGHIGANSLCDAAVQKLNFFLDIMNSDMSFSMPVVITVSTWNLSNSSFYSLNQAHSLCLGSCSSHEVF